MPVQVQGCLQRKSIRINEQNEHDPVEAVPKDVDYNLRVLVSEAVIEIVVLYDGTVVPVEAMTRKAAQTGYNEFLIGEDCIVPRV